MLFGKSPRSNLAETRSLREMVSRENKGIRLRADKQSVDKSTIVTFDEIYIAEIC